ncbi:hypothetical protein B0H14DRAFT_3533301 [Mycena olivaceomarginata]|nr:hypothetical protein B0H14DRAFT_3533301 [Mycena olivaceomarginata]
MIAEGAQRGNDLGGGVAREASTAPQQMLGRLVALWPTLRDASPPSARSIFLFFFSCERHPLARDPRLVSVSLSLSAPTPRAHPLPALLSTLVIWTLLLAHAEACVFRAVRGLEPWGEWERAARVFSSGGKGGEGEVPKDPSESVRREGNARLDNKGLEQLEIERALVMKIRTIGPITQPHLHFLPSPIPTVTAPIPTQSSHPPAAHVPSSGPLFLHILQRAPHSRKASQRASECSNTPVGPVKPPRAAKTNPKISAYFQQETAEERREYAEHAEMVRLREVERKKAARERVYANERMRQPLPACSTAWHAVALSPSCSRLAFPFASVQHVRHLPGSERRFQRAPVRARLATALAPSSPRSLPSRFCHCCAPREYHTYRPHPLRARFRPRVRDKYRALPRSLAACRLDITQARRALLLPAPHSNGTLCAASVRAELARSCPRTVVICSHWHSTGKGYATSLPLPARLRSGVLQRYPLLPHPHSSATSRAQDDYAEFTSA